MKVYRLPTDNNRVTLERLIALVDTYPSRWRSIPESDFSYKPSPTQWSQKEIIGHLIDSATNNHHRFVRSQYEDAPVITYDQDQWNIHNYYQALDGGHVISLWELYNQHLIELFRHMPESHKERTCRMENGEAYSVSWLFDDYVRHLEHHLRQVEAISAVK